MKTTRHQKVGWLLTEKSYGLRSVDCQPHDGTRTAVDAARQIDRHDRGRLRVHRLDHCTRQAINRTIKTSAE
jgi:hypothetical protein